MLTQLHIVLYILVAPPFVVPYLYPDDAAPERPDMDQNTYEKKHSDFYSAFYTMTKKEIKNLEQDTRELTASTLWQDVRRKYLSAVHFGDICNWKKNTSTAELVNKILYLDLNKEKVPETTSIKRSIFKEMSKSGYKINPSGMVIDKYDPCFVANPEGVISDHTVVVVKWFRAPEYGRMPAQNFALTNNNEAFRLFENTHGNQWSLNTRHNYYYEMQGVLHITMRSYGLLVLVGPVDFHIYPAIEKDDNFYKTNMDKRLKFFYVQCLMPELIDGRRKRKMSLRDIPMPE